MKIPVGNLIRYTVLFVFCILQIGMRLRLITGRACRVLQKNRHQEAIPTHLESKRSPAILDGFFVSALNIAFGLWWLCSITYMYASCPVNHGNSDMNFRYIFDDVNANHHYAYCITMTTLMAVYHDPLQADISHVPNWQDGVPRVKLSRAGNRSDHHWSAHGYPCDR